jgi:hypothetical protein
MNASPNKDWKELSQAAAQEKDPQKLMELVEQLNRVLEEREAELKQRRSPPVHESETAANRFALSFSVDSTEIATIG